jgi:16S rRNA (adenine(1408)-N(1))-methyltransferase
VIFDIGTGDGLYVYHAARSNPNNFYIGIDCNTRPLEKIGEKIFRKPSKGGVSNLLYLLAAVESLPSELDGIANEIHILFPWGNLLRAVALGETDVLHHIKNISAAHSFLEIVIGFDPQKDKQELARLGIPPLSLKFIEETLAPLYWKAGFMILKSELLSEKDWAELRTSWAQRLRSNPVRLAFKLSCRVQ